ARPHTGRVLSRRSDRRPNPRPAAGNAGRARVERCVPGGPFRTRLRIPVWDVGLSDTPPTRRSVRGVDAVMAMTDGTKPVRVVAVTQSDPFFTARFFEAFLEERAADRLELVEIVLLRNFNESKPALARRLLKLYGPVDLVRLLGRYAEAAVSDRLGRPRTVEAVASRHGVPVLRLSTINDEAYLGTLASRRVDVLLSVAAPEIFGRRALSATPH